MLELAGVRLTVREWQIVEQLVAGRTTPEIAQALHLSDYTVYQYVSRLLTKVGARRRGDLVVLALRAERAEHQPAA